MLTKLTKEEKAEMARALAFLREKSKELSQKRRLVAYPFDEAHTLFGLNTDIDYFPCNVFGKQLVLKIVDELLDID